MYYSNKSHSLSKQIANDANYNGTYTLNNLRPYTVYTVYVTAVRLIGGDASRPLEGVKSRTVTGKTLAGGKTQNGNLYPTLQIVQGGKLSRYAELNCNLL